MNEIISQYSLYIFPFSLALAVSLALCPLFIFFAKKFKFEKRKSKRHIHRKNISRLGGAAIISAFLTAIFFDPNLFLTPQIYGVALAAILILAIGFWDDFWQLNWKTQLFFQVCAAIIIFIAGVQVEYVSNPFGGLIFLSVGKYLIPSLIFGIAWIVILMNTVNWLDGLDGLSGGVSLIGILTIFFLSLKPEVNQPPVAIICAALAGAILGFLFFNFYPARILAGTSGAMFMGFSLAILSIFAGTKIATALLVMAIPLVDVFWVIWERLKSGVSIFIPDRRHLHHKLIELGWSQKKISFAYYSVTVIIAIVALNTRAIGKLITIILAILISAAFIIMINKKLTKIKKR